MRAFEGRFVWTASDFRNFAARLTLVNMSHLYLHKHLDGREAADQRGREFAHVHEACASAVRRMPAAPISHNAEPIGHISPYPRIDLSPVRTESAKPQALAAMEESKRIAEAGRIWRLVVQAA
jgi:hypothetical protein